MAMVQVSAGGQTITGAAPVAREGASYTYLIVALGIVAISAVVAVLVYESREPSRIVFGEGWSALAGIYILTQATERLLEPVSRVLLPTAPAKDELAGAMATATNTGSVADANAAAESKAKLERLTRDRTILFWGISTGVGLLVSGLFGIMLFWGIAQEGAPEPWLDVLATGLVVGGGSKSLHDLITRIEKSKEKAEAS